MVGTSVERHATNLVASAPTALFADRDALDVASASVRRRLFADLGENVFESWLKGLEVVDVSCGTVVYSLATKFLRNWIGSHFSAKILSATRSVFEGAERVEFVVRSGGRPREAVASTVAVTEATSMHAPPEQHPKAETRKPSQPGFVGVTSPLDPRCRFETYVTGDSNREAAQATLALANEEDGSDDTLFVHAKTGLGKSHLLQAACAEAVKRGRNVVYMTAERFMYGFVMSVKGQCLPEFKTGMDSVDMVALDDAQFLQGAAVTNEFRRVLKAMREGGRKVIIAADRPPSELASIDDATRDRLSKARIVNVLAPDYEVRLALVQSRISDASVRFPSLSVDHDVVVYLATTVASNGRDVEGAVNRLVAFSSLERRTIDVEAAKVAIRDMVAAREPRKVRIEDIQRLVANHYGVSREDVTSPRRTANIVRPRQVAMYISKVLTARSLPEIGRRFGGRDHTTVLHAVRKIEGLCVEDKALSDEIALFTRMLTE